MSLYTSYETSITLREAGAPQGWLGAVYWCPESPDYPTIHHHCCAVLHEHRDGMCGPDHPRAWRADEIIEALGPALRGIDAPTDDSLRWEVRFWMGGIDGDRVSDAGSTLVEALAAAWLAVLKGEEP